MAKLKEALILKKRVKRGHLLSDYRQKCVNGTRDILLKVRKMTILAIIMQGKGQTWIQALKN